jgi:hypothetical protein
MGDSLDDSAGGAAGGAAEWPAGRRRRGGPPVRCDPAARARFAEGLGRGLSLADAAKAGGCALASFYSWRRRDPAFAEDWEAAVEESAWPVPEGEEAARSGEPAKRRRLRLSGRRRRVYLETLELDCHGEQSARAAGVDRGTPGRLARRDPGFAEQCSEALERGYQRLGEELAAERAVAVRPRAWRELDIPPDRPERDFDTQIRLLVRWGRPDGSVGPRQYRRPRGRKWTFDEAIAQLARRLRALGIRVKGP